MSRRVDPETLPAGQVARRVDPETVQPMAPGVNQADAAESKEVVAPVQTGPAPIIKQRPQPKHPDAIRRDAGLPPVIAPVNPVEQVAPAAPVNPAEQENK
jgi:hypothetical protein